MRHSKGKFQEVDHQDDERKIGADVRVGIVILGVGLGRRASKDFVENS